MKNNNVSISFSSGIVTLLGAVLVVLKLLGLISIPWLWVLAPFWMPLAITIVILILVFIIGVLKAIL